MAKSVKRVPAFGDLLKELRGGRSVQAVLNTMPAAPDAIVSTQGTVSGYEQGYNQRLDPVVLWRLAKAYGVSLDGLIAVLEANRLDPDLTLDEARRILGEHSNGPSPEVAAEAIEVAERRLLTAASELQALRNSFSPSRGSARAR